MKRSSFLGGPVEELILSKWPITGLGECEIGFGICESSGLVMQTTAVSPETMLDYYGQTATYINPNDGGKPMPSKVRDLNRLLQTLYFTLWKHPASVLQYGSSDGYTLSRFLAAGAQRVLGVEPGLKAREYAEKVYGVDCIAGTAETSQVEGRFELIVLTHILEHLYDPLATLRRVGKNLLPDGHLLIEVPLWERIDKQPVGVLTFEHVNYFSEDALLLTLREAGFEPVFSSKSFDVNQYPVITVIAKARTTEYRIRDSKHDSRVLLAEYLKKEGLFWRAAEGKISAQLDPSKDTYIYGAGIHTSQMLSYTKLLDCAGLIGVIDSSSTKWGKLIAGFAVEGAEIVDQLPPMTNIIISSAASEKYIFRDLANRRTDLNLVKIYG
jgi:SAM-dependent methyltransferase